MNWYTGQSRVFVSVVVNKNDGNKRMIFGLTSEEAEAEAKGLCASGLREATTPTEMNTYAALAAWQAQEQAMAAAAQIERRSK